MPINQTTVLRHIQRRLGYKFSDLELSPDEIIETITEETLPVFSKYFPYIDRIRVGDEQRVPGYSNIFYLKSSFDTDIINVNRVVGLDLINSTGGGNGVDGNLMFATPRAGSQFSAGGNNPIDNQLMTDLLSMQSNPAVFQFYAPDRIEIKPNYSSISQFLIELNSVHPNSMITIPTNLRREFMNLAYADVCESLYPIRMRFENLQTTFGSMNLFTDQLNEGMQSRQEIMEKFQESLIRNGKRKKLWIG